MKNFTAIIVLFLLAATASAQNKVREMANETYVNRKTANVKKDGDLPTGTKKDGVLVGDRKGGNKQAAKDGETHSGNRDGVLVGDKQNTSVKKEGIMVSGREGVKTSDKQQRDGETEENPNDEDGETGTNNKDGVLVGDKRPGKKQDASKDGVLVGDRKGGGKTAAKDGVLVGDRLEGGDMDNGGKDGETEHGNRDGVLVGDRKGGETGTNNKDGVLVGDKIAPGKPGIYPNPAASQTTIQAPAGTTIARVQVFSAQGRQQMAVNGNKNQNLSINLAGLNPGAYIFRIQLSDGSSRSVSVVRK